MSKAATAPAFAGNYVWAFPGAPVKVYVPVPVLTKLREHVLSGHDQDPTRSKERGGFLLGKIRPARVDITGFRPFKPERAAREFVLADGEKAEFRAEFEGSKTEVVGYYRSDVRSGIRMSDEDMALVEDLFSDPKYIFLVARVANDGTPTAGFFFWDSGTIFREATFLQFPLDDRLLTLQPTGESSTPVAAPRFEQAVISVATEPVSVPAAKPSSGTSPYRLALLLVLVGLLGVAGTYLALRPGTQSAGVATQPGPSSPLSLWASRSQNTVAITWNSQAPLIADARIGVLTIKDGEAQRDLPLTKAQLQMSKLLYSPESDRLEVTLKVFSMTGESTRESIIVAVAQSGVVPQAVPAAPPKTPAATTESAPKPVRTFTAPVSQPNATPAAQEVLLETQALNPITSTVDIQTPEFLQSQAALPRAAAPTEPPTPKASGLPVQPPRALRQVKPVVPVSLATMLKRRVEVQVRVHIDAAGKVTAAEIAEPPTGMAQYLVANTLNAARRWVFEPANRNGVPLASEVVLRFTFGQNP